MAIPPLHLIPRQPIDFIFEQGHESKSKTPKVKNRGKSSLFTIRDNIVIGRASTKPLLRVIGLASLFEGNPRGAKSWEDRELRGKILAEHVFLEYVRHGRGKCGEWTMRCAKNVTCRFENWKGESIKVQETSVALSTGTIELIPGFVVDIILPVPSLGYRITHPISWLPKNYDKQFFIRVTLPLRTYIRCDSQHVARPGLNIPGFDRIRDVILFEGATIGTNRNCDIVLPRFHGFADVEAEIFAANSVAGKSWKVRMVKGKDGSVLRRDKDHKVLDELRIDSDQGLTKNVTIRLRGKGWRRMNFGPLKYNLFEIKVQHVNVPSTDYSDVN